MDEAKKYLFEHRDELDVESPRPQVWKHIQQQTGAKKKPVIPVMVKWLAAACVLAAAAVLIFRLQGTKETNPQTLVQVKNETIKTQEEKTTDTTSTETVLPKENKAIVHLAHKPKKVKPVIADEKPLSPLEAVEDNYTSIISYQLKRVEKTPIYAEDAGYFHVFKKQWLDLQKDEQKVKRDVGVYGMNDNVVNQLIQLYQQKLKLLQALQSEINKMNIRTKTHPSLGRKNPSYLKL